MTTVTYSQPITIDGVATTGTLTREVEQVDVSLSVESRPDPSWEYTDAAGHFHAWGSDGKLPTLKSVLLHEPCSQNDCCDGYDSTTLRCIVCDEEVFPGHIVNRNPPRRSILGRESWTASVNGYVNTSKNVSIVAGRYFGFGYVTGFENDHDRVTSHLVCGPMAQRLAVPTPAPASSSGADPAASPSP